MILTKPLACLAVLMPLLAACADSAPHACKVGRVADLKLLAGSGPPTVVASLDGQKVVVYIDTGAATSAIDQRAADRFDLRSGPEQGFVRLVGAGGVVNAPLVTIHHLVLGHGTARDIELPVAGTLGAPVDGMPVLGLFGGDFLSNYDVDIDVPQHRFALYRLRGCGADPRPLGTSAFAVPFTLDETKVMLDLKLNGKPFEGFLDTGASRTLISPGQAAAAGVATRDLAGDSTGWTVGIDGSRVKARMHRFASLEIGDETMQNFPLIVARTNFSDLVLGDDFLRSNEVWISYSQHLLYVRPEGSVTRLP